MGGSIVGPHGDDGTQEDKSGARRYSYPVSLRRIGIVSGILLLLMGGSFLAAAVYYRNDPLGLGMSVFCVVTGAGMCALALAGLREVPLLGNWIEVDALGIRSCSPNGRSNYIALVRHEPSQRKAILAAARCL